MLFVYTTFLTALAVQRIAIQPTNLNFITQTSKSWAVWHFIFYTSVRARIKKPIFPSIQKMSQKLPKNIKKYSKNFPNVPKIAKNVTKMPLKLPKNFKKCTKIVPKEPQNFLKTSKKTSKNVLKNYTSQFVGWALGSCYFLFYIFSPCNSLTESIFL